jgi:hypothetical protein
MLRARVADGRLICAAFFGGLAAACAGGDSRGAAVQVDGLPRLAAVEELRLGSTDDPDAGFSSIGAVAVDGQGRIYVVERQDRQLRAYTPQGEHLFAVGRAGEGPGEFGRPEQIGVRGDTIWIHDTQLGRVTLYSHDGALIDTYAGSRPLRLESPAAGVLLYNRGGSVRGDGYLHLEDAYAIAILDGGIALPDSLPAPLLRVARDGSVVDTTRYLMLYLVPHRDTGSPGRPAQTEYALDPGQFFGTPLRLVTDDGIVLIDRRPAEAAQAAAFAVAWLNAAGDTGLRREYGYAPMPMPQAVADSLRTAAGFTAPAFRPPVSGAHAGADGSVWLRREVRDGEDVDWLVLGRDGTARGVVALPAEAMVRWADGQSVLVVERDPLDVPWLVRYRIGESSHFAR